MEDYLQKTPKKEKIPILFNMNSFEDSPPSFETEIKPG